MRPKPLWKAVLLLQILIGASSLAASSARADGISFTVSSSSLETTSGGTVTFEGTITNSSGGDLNASDFFFNFFGFDPTSVDPSQDLGVVTDFLIPDGSTSAIVALFEVTLGSVPDGSTFPVQVQLEDINSDLSDTQTVSVVVSASGGTGSGGGTGTGGGTTAPEPATGLLLAASLCAFCFTRRRSAAS